MMRKHIPDNDDYSLTEDGRVFSHKRKKIIEMCLLGPGSNGYYYIRINKNGIGKSLCIHRLMMETFVGPRPLGFHIAHLDGCRTNNNLSNLKYTSVKENQGHRIAHGTNNTGSVHGMSKITEEDVREIQRRFVRINSKRSNTKELAKEFGICRQNVQMIVSGKAWTHV